MTAMASTIRTLCVEDNPQVAEALKLKLGSAGSFEWMGWLDRADRLIETITGKCPEIIVLDIDMPGLDPFAAAARVAAVCGMARVVVFTGHVRPELIERAIDAGVWAYVSKNDGEDELVRVIRRVHAGEMVLSPSVRSSYDRG